MYPLSELASKYHRRRILNSLLNVWYRRRAGVLNG